MTLWKCSVSALCLSPPPRNVGALLLHSVLSRGVMDPLPAACGTGCTESARRSNTEHLECMQTMSTVRRTGEIAREAL